MVCPNEMELTMLSAKNSVLIHSTAVVSEKATIHNRVRIGPYCVVGDNVILREGVELQSHVYIDGITEICENTKIFPFAAIGCIPQDLKYQGEESRVRIGKNTTIREHVTIHGGTKLGRTETIIGDECLLMAASHVAHDCIIGNNVVMSNNATLGGHVIVEDNVIIGGLAAVHQFVRVGKHVIIGGVSAVTEDIAPYASVSGDRAKILGINVRGLKRHGFKNEDIIALHQAYTIIFENTTESFESRMKKAETKYEKNEKVLEIVRFLRSNKIRPICTSFK